MLESKEKKYVDELKSYFKLFQNNHQKLQIKQNPKKRGRSKSHKHMAMSFEEKLQLRDTLQSFLSKSTQIRSYK